LKKYLYISIIIEMNPDQDPIIRNSDVNTFNLSQAAKQEREKIEILNNLSIYLSSNCIVNHAQQEIAHMLFQSLAQYRGRKNFDTFWIEIDNFFASILTYEKVYDNYYFNKICNYLQSLDHFPNLLQQFNQINQQRKLEETKRQENSAKYLAGQGNFTICIGTTSTACSVANTVSKPVAPVEKTTRSGLKY
jgi:hypothetical protein